MRHSKEEQISKYIKDNYGTEAQSLYFRLKRLQETSTKSELSMYYMFFVFVEMQDSKDRELFKQLIMDKELISAREGLLPGLLITRFINVLFTSPSRFMKKDTFLFIYEILDILFKHKLTSYYTLPEIMSTYKMELDKFYEDKELSRKLEDLYKSLYSEDVIKLYKQQLLEDQLGGK